jgi:hypothetical protein
LKAEKEVVVQAADKGTIELLPQKTQTLAHQEVCVSLEFFLRLALAPFEWPDRLNFAIDLRRKILPPQILCFTVV